MPTALEAVRKAFAGSYDIERELGSGGMATVYLAKDLKHDRKVAIKILRPELAAAMGPDRFPREIRIVAQLQHPHVLPLHDSGETGGFLYFVMPFVDGESLRAKLNREGQLPVHDAVKILREIADALAYAHNRGVLHRDIKPDNVMLSGRHALVMDFGVAKAVSSAGGDKVTTVGIAIGTPAYMSPEQATGQENLDQRSDIYALGILGYELLTGGPPFKAKTAQAILSQHMVEPAPDVTQGRPSVPRPLADIIMRCLEKNPADRWQSAEDILHQLEAVATPSGGVTPTDTRPVRITRKSPAGNRRMFVTAGVVGVLALVGFGTWRMVAGGSIPGPNRIAVLPLTDVSGKDGELVQALHSQLIVALGQIPGASVAPSSAMEVYKTAPKPALEVANALHVGAILEGNVFRAGNRLRITLQLTNPRTIAQIWSQSFDLDLSGDLLKAIDGVIPQITAGVGKAITARSPSP